MNKCEIVVLSFSIWMGWAVHGFAEDRFLWLEEVEGEKALEWVKDWNEATVAELQKIPEFAEIKRRSLEILDSEERIAYPTIRGDYVYNFWQDAEHIRGIWRRTTLNEYLEGQPGWEIVIDVDALAEAEGENWVYKGSSCLYPDYRYCMIRLSRGGGDAVVQREFDTVTKSFVKRGFELAEAKSRTSWRDENSLWVATDLGEGTLTESGYPRISKLWKRGTDLSKSEAVLEGRADDVAVATMSLHTATDRYDLAIRTPAFFQGENFLILDGRKVKLDLPIDAELEGFFKDQMLISLRSDWTIGGNAYLQDSLLVIDLDRFLSGKRDFETLFKPSERTSRGQVATTRDRVLLTTLDNVRSRLYEFSFNEGSWTRETVDLPRLGTISIVSVSEDLSEYFVSYTDYLTPSSLFFIEDRQARKVRSLPAFFNSEGLEVVQYEVSSEDGTKIPYFLIKRRDLPLNGHHPTVLYGYGGFEIPVRPGYLPTTGAAWLEKGGVYAVANIRGGGEFGPRWHQAALKTQRHKAFQDFIAVAEDLIKRKITSPENLGIRGGSNGGLLVGSVFTQRPELFNAVVCQVPLLDMKRYTKLLAGASWMAEYGDPDQPDMWKYIKTYSPYHNVSRNRKYPKVLFMTSTKDDRVHPGHARKMVALMSDLGHPVYYYENTEGGHAAATNNEQRAYMQALVYSYLWKELR